MISFLKSSKYYEGISFQGCFSISEKDLNLMHEYYINTGVNVIDQFCEIVYATWDNDPRTIMDGHESILLLRSLRDPIIKSFFSQKTRSEIKTKAIKWFKGHKQFIKHERRDRNASPGQAYIRKKEIREWVFQKYGRKCLCCGSKKNLTIDHIKAVHCGGKDEKENLQPLCNRCNSSKGIKEIDYR